jgi:hypothetical protein
MDCNKAKIEKCLRKDLLLYWNGNNLKQFRRQVNLSNKNIRRINTKQ